MGTKLGAVIAALLYAGAVVAQGGAGGLPPGAAGDAPQAVGGAPDIAPAGGVPPAVAGAAGGAPAVAGAAGGAPETATPASGPATLSSPVPPATPAATPYTPPEPVYEAVEPRPMPAFMAPLAAQHLMLGMARAGQGLVAVGAHGDIVRSTDGGRHWVQSAVPVRELLTAVCFADPEHGWAVGHDATILATSDGGTSWAVQHFDPKFQAPLLNLYFSDARHGFALGAFGLLLRTADGGQSWQEVAADDIRNEQLNFYALVRLGDGNLLIVGEQGLVGASRDGGETWAHLPSPWNGTFFGALPVGEHGALIYGLRGRAFMADDALSGAWRQIPTHTTASFYGAAPLADGRFVLVGSAGTILVVAADGSEVTPVTGASSQDYSAVLPLGHELLLAGMRGIQHAALDGAAGQAQGN